MRKSIENKLPRSFLLSHTFFLRVVPVIPFRVVFYSPNRGGFSRATLLGTSILSDMLVLCIFGNVKIFHGFNGASS